MTDLGMTGLFAALSASKLSVMIVFGVLAVATVGGLELFRAWLGRQPPEETASPVYDVAAFVTLAFMVLLVMGGTDMAAEGKTFLNVSFALFGAAGVVIVAFLLRRFRHGLPLPDDGDADEDELRRIDAHDL
jgi:hypothetical protein